MKSTTYQQRLLEANGFDPKTPIEGHIKIGLLGVAAKRNNIHNGALNENSPYVFKQLQTFSSYNLHCPNLTVPESTLKWWVLKPDNDAMSKNVCFLDGSRANLLTILNLFRGHSAFQFTTGSIDLFITKNNEYGVFEFQPQFGVMDVPLSVMQEYRQSFLSYVLTHFNRSK